MARIDELTNELVEDLGSKTLTWLRIFNVLEEVNREKLYQSLELKSFTAYIRFVAEKARCQERYIWRVWKAGKFYKTLEETEAGKEVIEQAKKPIGDEVLTIIEGIAEGDTETGTKILKEFVSGELTKQGIKDIYREKRSNRNREESVGSTLPAKSAAINVAINKEENSEDRINSNDILEALKPSIFGLDERPEGKGMSSKKAVYEVFPEFRVDTGMTRNGARIDALIVSNVDSGDRGLDQYHVSLRGIEIKISKSDLENDHKMTEYSPHVDRSYIAVPEDLGDLAATLVPETWGILLFSKSSGELRVKREAHFTPGRLRSITLETIAIKKCKELLLPV